MDVGEAGGYTACVCVCVGGWRVGGGIVCRVRHVYRIELKFPLCFHFVEGLCSLRELCERAGGRASGRSSKHSHSGGGERASEQEKEDGGVVVGEMEGGGGEGRGCLCSQR